MQLFIVVFCVLDLINLSSFAIYPVLILYFFPWVTLSKSMMKAKEEGS